MDKKKVIFILSIVILAIIIVVLVVNKENSKSRLYELDVNEVIEKINNKKSFILLISQTTCSHCNSYKPKLSKVSSDYKLDIYYIDYDLYGTEEKELFRQNVSFDGNTPVTVMFKEGTEATTSSRIYGDVSIDKIIEKFKKNGFIK